MSFTGASVSSVPFLAAFNPHPFLAANDMEGEFLISPPKEIMLDLMLPEKR